MCDTAEMLCTSSRDCGMLHFIGGVFLYFQMKLLSVKVFARGFASLPAATNVMIL